MKYKKSDDKITFLSWQSDNPSVDFKLLADDISAKKAEVKTVFLTKRFKKSISGGLSYYFHMYRQMYHIVSSKVLVLDSYVPIVSILNHKNELKVVQLWHALGAIKQFGYQTVGKPGGRSESSAKNLNMHKNYNWIISSSKKTSVFYSKAFDYTLENMLECGLPRIDYLLNNKEKLKKQICEAYPVLSNGKKNVLYAPTFRNNGTEKTKELIDAFDAEEYNLIIKPHLRQSITMDEKKVISPKGYTSMELLTITDYLITDYSAIALEAAVLDVPTLYFLYDYEEYKLENGLNMDPYEIAPENVFENAENSINAITNYKVSGIMKADYLPEKLGDSTDKITELILSEMEGHR